jgi:hypothetical protein
MAVLVVSAGAGVEFMVISLFHSRIARKMECAFQKLEWAFI